MYFYPRSPCGERLSAEDCKICIYDISIHALLAESDLLADLQIRGPFDISIHALLAESDKMDGTDDITATLFLSTLSLRRATF